MGEREEAQEGIEEWMWSKNVIYMYENVIMKPTKMHKNENSYKYEIAQAQCHLTGNRVCNSKNDNKELFQ
jgi:hypothetical protein